MAATIVKNSFLQDAPQEVLDQYIGKYLVIGVTILPIFGFKPYNDGVLILDGEGDTHEIYWELEYLPIVDTPEEGKVFTRFGQGQLEALANGECSPKDGWDIEKALDMLNK